MTARQGGGDLRAGRGWYGRAFASESTNLNRGVMVMISILFAWAVLQSPVPIVQWGGDDSGVTRTRIELVTDATMLEAAWRLTHGGEIDDLPRVDFDRSRLVLACRGSEMDVRRVTATGIERTDFEVVLTIDAGPTEPGEAGPSEATTAWGLFVIPKTPQPVRVRYDASEDRDGDPRWETIIVLGGGGDADGRPRGDGESPERHRPSEEHLERLRRPWTGKLAEPPRYFISHGYDARWSAAIKSGIDVTRDYLGNYGPVQVYIVGQEDDELSDPVHRNDIAETFCRIHNQGTDRPMEECLASDGREMARKAAEGVTEAFMTMAMDADPPIAELVFINAHTMGGVELMPTRSIHEYVHVYQKAFEFTPTWMMEGGAELLAAHLGAKHGWGDRDRTLEWYARNLAQAKDLEFTIRDMEEIETAAPEVAKWHRELAYDAGAWAVAFAISKSPSRSIGRYFRTIYPMVDELGWKAALCRYTGVQDIDAFYAGFEALMAQPLKDRMSMLETLED